MTRRVVITGMGAVTPLGVGAGSLHGRWAAGECGITEGLARCADFDATDFMSVKEARRSDRFVQLAVAASAEALDRRAGTRTSPMTGTGSAA